MKKKDFINTLEKIYSIADLKIIYVNFMDKNIPYSMNVLNNMNIDDEVFCIQKMDNDNIFFSLFYLTKVELCISMKDILEDDQYVYYVEDGVLKQYSNSLSFVLLINLSLWIYSDVGKYKTTFKEKSAEYYSFVKNNYNFIGGDRPLINQLYMNENSFMIFLNKNIEYFIVARDQLILSDLQIKINEIKDRTGNKVKNRISSNLKYDFIFDLKSIENTNILCGRIKINNEKIDVQLDPEKNEPTIKDYNFLAKKLKEVMIHFSSSREMYDLLKEEISRSVLTDVYQQSNVEGDTIVRNNFKENMKLKRIEVFDAGYMFIYDIKSDRDENMYVQLDFEYSIEEITIN
jgi:hypothetical protein